MTAEEDLKALERIRDHFTPLQFEFLKSVLEGKKVLEQRILELERGAL